MGLVILDRINYTIRSRLRRQFFNQGEKVAISNYLDERLIAFIDVENRDAALVSLVDVLAAAGKIKNKEVFHRALLEREKIVSTGIGRGVAIPHAKLESCNDFFIVVGIQKDKGLDWKALDGSLVKLIFMIGGPEHKQTEYLHILSSLTVAIKDEEKRKKLLSARTPHDVIEVFKDC